MMELSQELQKRLEHAARKQLDYRPAVSVRSKIADKTLVMVIAPTAMGKTFVMNMAVELDDRVARVSVFTTRDPRPDDQAGMFRYYQRNEHDLGTLLDKIDHKKLVQYAIFPHSGQMYGSEPQDFPRSYNLLATLSNSVEQLSRVGFRAAVPVGLIANPKVWCEWFDARYGDRHRDRPARLKEALESIDWLLANDEARWLVNEPGRVENVARQLIKIAHNPDHQNNAQAIVYARRMRDLITRMIQ